VLDNHSGDDAHINYATKEIHLNLKEIERFAIEDRTTFEIALIRIISHEEIHRCLFIITTRDISRKFDNYCKICQKTAIAYNMW
jgi:hypothetical protein